MISNRSLVLYLKKESMGRLRLWVYLRSIYIYMNYHHRNTENEIINFNSCTRYTRILTNKLQIFDIWKLPDWEFSETKIHIFTVFKNLCTTISKNLLVNKSYPFCDFQPRLQFHHWFCSLDVMQWTRWPFSDIINHYDTSMLH